MKKKIGRIFEISADDYERVLEWDKEQNSIFYESQITKNDEIGAIANTYGKAYYGATGGHLTFSFTPTGLGTCLEVTHGGTDEVLDLTHVEDW